MIGKIKAIAKQFGINKGNILRGQDVSFGRLILINDKHIYTLEDDWESKDLIKAYATSDSSKLWDDTEHSVTIFMEDGQVLKVFYNII